MVPDGALLVRTDNVCRGFAACCRNIRDMDGHRSVSGDLSLDFPLLMAKLPPCLSYSRRRDRINSEPNLIRYEMKK